eukprot:COSAG04_NODE_12647_length_642_cov_0.850829_2_plen_32_part_01
MEKEAGARRSKRSSAQGQAARRLAVVGDGEGP